MQRHYDDLACSNNAQLLLAMHTQLAANHDMKNGLAGCVTQA
jgi:hypothetical protein